MSNHEDSLRVLHFDDDLYDLELFADALKQSNDVYPFTLCSVSKLDRFREEIGEARTPDIVVLDIHLKDNTEKTGIELVSDIKRELPRAIIIMRSIADDVATLTDCLRSGADDFLSKRTDKSELGHRLMNAYNLASLKRGTEVEPSSVVDMCKRRFVGGTLQTIGERIPNIVKSAVSCVHVFGESGTGKEAVADLLGDHLGKSTPFVRVNCGAIAPNIMESELFGSKKGAFTGATADRRGLFESAHHGWIFLDEIASLTPSAQSALLRVIENQELYRLGSTTPISLEIKVLSATNEDIEDLIRDGKFRQDLWQRLSEVRLTLPPLRARPNEIESIVKYFCATMSGGPYQITQPAVEILCAASWKNGNIRELRNCLRAMTEFSMDQLLTPLAIPKHIWDEVDESPEQTGSPRSASSSAVSIELIGSDEDPLSYDYLSKSLLLKVTEQAAKQEGKLSLRRLSHLLGIPRSTLTQRLRELVTEKFVEVEALARLVNLKK